MEVAARTFLQTEAPFALTPQDSKTDIRVSVWDTRGFWTIKPDYQGIFDNNVDFRAKTVTLEDDGRRQVPCAMGSPQASQKLYLLGDSQTFGWGLSDTETWANRLQCALNKKMQNAYQVRNYGFPGAQVDQIFKRGIQQIVPATRPGDVVIISITWNDLINFYSGRVFVRYAAAEAGLSVNEDTWNSIAPIKSPLFEKNISRNPASLALQLKMPLHYLNPPSWRYSFYLKHGIFVPSLSSTDAFLVSMKYASVVFRIALSTARLIYYRWRSKESLIRKFPKDTVANNFFVIKSLTTAFERKGAQVIVQLLPPRQFFDTYYYRTYSNNGLTFPTQDYMGYLAKPWCERMGLTCQNPFSKLKTVTRDAHSFTFDGHYNAAGALVISNALIDKIKP